MSEHNYIACDGCGATRRIVSRERELWSHVSIECPVALAPEIALGLAKPGTGYKFISGLDRHFCPACTESKVVPLLTLTSETRLPPGRRVGVSTHTCAACSETFVSDEPTRHVCNPSALAIVEAAKRLGAK